MINKNNKKKKKEWIRFIEKWKSYEPPMVPSKREIEIYEEFIKEKKGGNTLIFGATPQLRDILYKLGYNVTLIDFNERNIIMMETLMRYKNNKETKIISNWLDIEKINFNKKFDLIVGDHFINNVGFKHYEFLFKKINELLKEDGFFIANFMVSYDEEMSFSKLICLAKKRQIKIDNEKDRFSYYYSICTNEPIIFNHEKQEFNMADYDKILKILVNNKKLSKELAENLMVKHFDENYFVSIPRMQIMMKLINKYFDILENNRNHEHNVFKHYQMFKLRKVK